MIRTFSVYLKEQMVGRIDKIVIEHCILRQKGKYDAPLSLSAKMRYSCLSKVQISHIGFNIPKMENKKTYGIIWKICHNLRYLFYYFLIIFFRDKYIFVKAWVRIEHGVVLHRNWGDELNEHFIQFLTKRKCLLIFPPSCRLERYIHFENYYIIGSILTMCNLERSIVWGAGILNNNIVDKMRGTPDRIYAVRGPRTRNELLKKGIPCPEVYGDPALLLPRFYQPVIRTHYSVGIIPHWEDLNKDDVLCLCRDPRVKLIKVQGYDEWTDFIDEICSCDFIISSSLHGLIVAEAYGIPSKWVEFGTYADGWEFKYYDFYESIGKMDESPLHIDETTTCEMLLDKKKDWKKGNIDLDKLMDACPIR